jgi:hypothetical protein
LFILPFIEVQRKQFDAFVLLVQFALNRHNLFPKLPILLLQNPATAFLLLQLQGQLLDQFFSLAVDLTARQL